MSLTGWRQFNFFDLIPIRDPSSPLGSLLYSDPSLTAICRGKKNVSVFFATSKGDIKEFSQDFALKRSFRAFDDDNWTISHLKYLDGTSLLLCIGHKQGVAPLVQLWDLENKSGVPYLHSTVKVTNSSNIYPLTTFAISSNYNILAFGFADGSVILSRGDIVHDRGSVQRLVYSGNSPITGLEFHEDGQGIVTLYCVSLNQVFTLTTNGKNNGKPDVILDKSKGGALGCVTIEDGKKDGELIIARDDEVQYYTTKHRDISFVLDVHKKSAYSYKHYLVMTTSKNSEVSASDELIYGDTTRLLVVDTVNKYVAFNGQISLGVKHIFQQWDSLNILGSDGILYSLKEKPLQDRLDILTSRNLYDTALKLVQFLNADDEQGSISNKIELEYGNFLYDEGELEEAVDHFIKAIQLKQTSHVILKYRGSTHIELLTKYLETLHDTGNSTKEHSTLLLNSYAKLKAGDKMERFIKHSLENGENESHFDYNTAIQICRDSGYFELAIFLAKKINDTDLVVAMKLRDLKDYKGCLQYVKSLSVNDALRILIQHSRVLLDNFPMETTAVLINLFTCKFVPHPEIDEQPPDVRSQFTESTLTAPVVQSYRAFLNYMAPKGFFADHETKADEDQDSERAPTYQPPRPKLIFASFVKHPNEFVIFLEACIECYDDFGVSNKDKRDLVNTLFEMYLNLARQSSELSAREGWQNKAKALLQQFEQLIDRNTIFLLSHLLGYHEGELLAREKDEDFEIDLFRSCLASGDVSGAVEILHKYGSNSSSSARELYPLALSFFSSTAQRLEEVGKDEFVRVLNEIKERRLMSPLQVVQMVSSTNVVPLGYIKNYLIEVIKSERTEIGRNNQLTDLYRKEADAKKEEIRTMLHDPAVVQYVTCTSCGTPLDLPAVHFACKHSYHQRCLNLTDDFIGQGRETLTCSNCLHEIENIETVRRSQQATSENNELFFTTLQESRSKFKIITDFIGRGALSSI